MSELVARVRPAAGEPEGALVLLHGRGADEHDLFGLLDLLDPDRRLHGVTPGAPLSLPPGGRHWYRLGGIPTPEPADVPSLGRAPRGAALRASGAARPGGAGRVLTGSRDVVGPRPWPRTDPAGRHHRDLRVPPACAGFSLDATRLAGLPVGVAHGTADPVIPVAFGDEASDFAEAAGAQLTRLRSPVPHMVDPAWIGPLADVVTAAIPPGGRS